MIDPTSDATGESARGDPQVVAPATAESAPGDPQVVAPVTQSGPAAIPVRAVGAQLVVDSAAASPGRAASAVNHESKATIVRRTLGEEADSGSAARLDQPEPQLLQQRAVGGSSGEPADSPTKDAPRTELERQAALARRSRSGSVGDRQRAGGSVDVGVGVEARPLEQGHRPPGARAEATRPAVKRKRRVPMSRARDTSNLKAPQWTPEEDETLMRMYDSFGGELEPEQWLQVAAALPRRSVNGCKARLVATLRKQQREERLLEPSEADVEENERASASASASAAQAEVVLDRASRHLRAKRTPVALDDEHESIPQAAAGGALARARERKKRPRTSGLRSDRQSTMRSRESSSSSATSSARRQRRGDGGGAGKAEQGAGAASSAAERPVLPLSQMPPMQHLGQWPLAPGVRLLYPQAIPFPQAPINVPPPVPSSIGPVALAQPGPAREAMRGPQAGYALPASFVQLPAGMASTAETGPGFLPYAFPGSAAGVQGGQVMPYYWAPAPPAVPPFMIPSSLASTTSRTRTSFREGDGRDGDGDGSDGPTE